MMRIPRPRLGLRGLMAVVAIAAALLGWRQRRTYEALHGDYEDRAFDCGEMQEIWRRHANLTHEEWLELCRWVEHKNKYPDEWSGGRSPLYMTPEPPDLARRKADHWARLKTKYERAALRPWAPIEPDEPEP